MRYWLMSMAVVLFAVASADTQETKGKDGKDPKGEPKEPTEFMGKSYDAWRKELKSGDPSKRENAMKAVLMFGLPKAADAIPEVIADLNQHVTKKKVIDLSVRINGMMAMNTYFLHTANAKKVPADKVVKDALVIYKSGMKDTQAIIRMRSVQGLQYLGAAGRELLDDVITLTGDGATWDLRKEAIPVMVMLTDPKTPETKVMIALRKRVSEKDEPSHVVRAVAVTGLGIVAKGGALVDLQRALKDPSKDVRLAAVQAFVHAKAAAIPDLRKVVNDSEQEKDVRLLAVQALGAAGGPQALGDLYKIVDPDIHPKERRLMGLNTISAIKQDMSDTEKAAAASRLKKIVEPDALVNIWRNATIMNLNGKCDKLHMDPINKRVNDKDNALRVQALQAISACGPEAKAFALPTVLDAVKDKDTNISVRAVQTLVFIYAIETVPMLEAITKDKSVNEELKEAAEDAIDDLNLQKAQKEKKKKDDKK